MDGSTIGGIYDREVDFLHIMLLLAKAYDATGFSF